jgi:hypothetical protein
MSTLSSPWGIAMSDITIPRGNYAFGTTPGQAPEFAVLHLMLNDVLAASPMSRSDALTYALAWLAAGKLLAAGEIAGCGEYSDLLQRDCWEAAERSGLPNEVVSLVWPADGNGRVQDWVNVKLLGLLADFTDQFELQEREFADALAEISGPETGGYDSGMCDAIVNLLQAPLGRVVWIPFDGTGQLTIRALKQGLKVVLDGPGQNRWSVLMVRLLAVIAGKADMLSTDAGMRTIDTQEVGNSFDYLIACPPIGMRLQPGAGWRRWEGYELGLPGSDAIYKRLAGQHFVQLDRAEPWAMAALWPRVKVRAVFMTGLNLLFAKGQEQRLREFLVHGLQQPSAVATLPPKLLHHAGIPVALTVFDRTCATRLVRLVDSSSMTIESKSTMRFSRHLDSAALVHAIQSQEGIDDVAKTVSFDEVIAQECNLMPVRYLKALAAGDLDRVALGDLVDVVIRAPVVSKDPTSFGTSPTTDCATCTCAASTATSSCPSPCCDGSMPCSKQPRRGAGAQEVPRHPQGGRAGRRAAHGGRPGLLQRLRIHPGQAQGQRGRVSACVMTSLRIWTASRPTCRKSSPSSTSATRSRSWWIPTSWVT